MMYYGPNTSARGALFLVSCTGQKRDAIAPARDLYMRSRWFRAARAYVEHAVEREPDGAAWAIVSAAHGLLMPGEIIAPYNRHVGQLTQRERAVWAGGIDLNFAGGGIFCRPHPARVVLLAGAAYCDLLVPMLQARQIRVERPLQSLGIGQQYAWLVAQVAGERAA